MSIAYKYFKQINREFKDDFQSMIQRENVFYLFILTKSVYSICNYLDRKKKKNQISK